MNSLSWLIYFIELSGQASLAIAIMIGVFVVASIIATISFLVVSFDGTVTKATRERLPMIQKWLAIAYAGLAFLVVLQVVIPGRSTAVVIAASEVAKFEQASPVRSDPTISLLNSWITQQLRSAQR